MRVLSLGSQQERSGRASWGRGELGKGMLGSGERSLWLPCLVPWHDPKQGFSMSSFQGVSQFFLAQRWGEEPHCGEATAVRTREIFLAISC